MTVLITMAGLGSRFTLNGYTVPKYKIKVYGRTLFEWSMFSLREFYQDEFVFATLEGIDKEWLVEHARKVGITRLKVISRKSVSLGQAETAFEVASHIQSTDPLWIYNIDTFVKSGMRPSDINGFSGCVYVFDSNDPSMSFVKFNKYGIITDIAEKNVISNWATVGMYGFENVETFQNIYFNFYLNNKLLDLKGERYIAPMYEYLIRNQKQVFAHKISTDNIHILGTPSQVINFDPLALPPMGNC